MKIRMPGKSFTGPVPGPTDELQVLAKELEKTIVVLANDMGPRHVGVPDLLERAAVFIESEFEGAGLQPTRQTYTAANIAVSNIEARLPSKNPNAKTIVVGAHYDTVPNTPGANDNGSGVAGVLALARRLATAPVGCHIRLLAFVNEEPPFFQSELMGSWVYARGCKERGEAIDGMISLETIGFFSDAKGSQNYPSPFGALFPSEGNFIAFVGESGSSKWIKEVTRLFRENAKLPSEGAALPAGLTGVGWSDHWSFSQHGYEALMATDTAPFRYPHYHMPHDTPDQLDYHRMARVVDGVHQVLLALGAQ
ncbi:MAG: hypothetical protein A2289_08110 [Deltaproteobacteria bacterium RIFOXYA12_FULL_58_15]|nr:MAG: hypothetical protein A2289_08110 [Deltaproteobacteria bacterium RIFOXYA12_FULL_58_15]OGR09497.1 MAG: hypothetical protein A2341_01655 [Deltaproteobacteria bacterium RIFOXYB12_FULL_58_9]